MKLKSAPGLLMRKLGANRNSNSYIFFQKIYWVISKQSEKYKTFSQFGEDQILRAFLPESKGSYLDIGAGNFRHGNNTYFLYKKGWSGTAIEPIISFSRGYKLRRRRDRLIRACVSSQFEESRIFYEFHPWQLSTMSLDRCLDLGERGIHPRRTYKVPIMTIKSLEQEINPLEPYLLTIDVEGAELEVLAGVDWKVFRPRVICLEDFGNPISNMTPIKSEMIKLGYKLVSQALLSSIYVHTEYLREGFFAKSLGLYDDENPVQSHILTHRGSDN